MSAQINQIEQDGQVYEFVDAGARDQITALATRVTAINDAHNNKISEESERAKAAEAALEENKMTKIPDMGLSSNDFSDSYKELVDNPLLLLGASADGDGRKGIVPVPLQGQQDMFLRGDATWAVPHDTTYENATHEVAGLMSPQDKYKLDNAKMDVDEEVSSNTVFNGNVITETLGNGRVKKTTFNADGSIKQEITKAGADKITLTTVFNADGSITRTRT